MVTWRHVSKIYSLEPSTLPLALMGLSAETVFLGGEQLGVLYPTSLSWRVGCGVWKGIWRACCLHPQTPQLLLFCCSSLILFIVLPAPSFCFICFCFPSFSFSAILSRMLLLPTVVLVLHLDTFLPPALFFISHYEVLQAWGITETKWCLKLLFSH